MNYCTLLSRLKYSSWKLSSFAAAVLVAGIAISLNVSCQAEAKKAAATESPDFSVRFSSSNLTIEAGTGTGQLVLGTLPIGGFNQTVTVNLSNIPAGVAVSPASFRLAPGTKQTVTVLASSKAVAGSHAIALDAFSGSTHHAATVSVAVKGSTKTQLSSTMTPTGATLVSGTMALPSGFMKSVKDYGAVGNGTTDDTSAIQAALADGRSNATGNYYGVPKALYFPPGTYLVRDTLSWNGCCVTLQGAGPGASVIRLAPSSPGFNNAVTPKAILSTPAGNASFRQNIWDIGFKVGPKNPGAIALDYISNNNGAIRDVSIVSEDLQGVTGISLVRHYPGPLMIKNVSVVGFQSGIQTAAYEYGPTIEGLSLQKQSVAGIYNQQQTLVLRNFKSNNCVPAVVNNGGFVIVLDANLAGGSSTTQAIQNTSNLYLRNITSSGYGATLQDTSVSPASTVTGKITEYVKGAPQSLFSTPTPSSLNLGVAETPTYNDTNLAKWGAFVPAWYGDTKGLQALFDSGVSTIYFPFGPYLSYNEAAITVPDTVKRIVGFSSVINGNVNGVNGGGIRFIVNSSSTQPLVIEQFGYGIKVDHQGSRPVAVKNGRYTYTSSAGAGNLFLEDVELGPTTFQAGQNVWARQLDNESAGTKVTNNGSLWILGLKTEQAGTIINTNAGGNTELLGNLLYPAQGLPTDSIAFQSTDAKVSYIYSQSVYCSTCGYSTQVWESRSGSNAQLTWPQNMRFIMHLYVGY